MRKMEKIAWGSGTRIDRKEHGCLTLVDEFKFVNSNPAQGCRVEKGLGFTAYLNPKPGVGFRGYLHLDPNAQIN